MQNGAKHGCIRCIYLCNVQPHVEWADRATSYARDQATSTDDADEAGFASIFVRLVDPKIVQFRDGKDIFFDNQSVDSTLKSCLSSFVHSIKN